MAEHQTFLDYIKTRRITDTPSGDFTYDARRDQNFPDVQSWEELRRYLSRKTNHPEVIAAARSVWGQYIQKRNREYRLAQAHEKFLRNN